MDRDECPEIPVISTEQSHAEHLLDGFLDGPEPNEAANRAARERDMEPVFETARKYAGPRLELSLDSGWGVTTFELG